jgi:hypothetical protein
MTEYHIHQNLDALTAMASNLTPYLYETELFGHLGGTLPKLTVGGLLMRLYQLRHLTDDLTAEQDQQVHDAAMNLDAARHEWATHFEQKILKEIEARVNGIKGFLEEDAGMAVGGWRNEAEKRTILQHLANEARHLDILPGDLADKIHHIDGRLRQIHHDGDFIWDKRLESAYPKGEYWWLYGGARPVEK